MRIITSIMLCLLVILFAGQSMAQETQQTYDSLFGSCMTCAPVTALYDYLRTTAQELYVNISAPAGKLLAYLTAFYMLYIIFNMLSPFGSGSKNADEIYSLLIKSVFISSILLMPEFVRDYIVDPIFNIGLDAAMSLVTITKGSISTASNSTCADTSIVINKMKCVIHITEENLSWGILAGWLDIKNISILNMEFGSLFAIVIIMIYGKNFITTPIMIVEVIFVYGLLLIATPLILLAFLLPQTKQMLHIAIRHVIRLGFIMLFLSAVVNVIPFMMGYLVNDLLGDGIIKTGGVQGFLAAIESRDITFSPAEKPFWYMSVTGVIIGSMFSVAKSIANALSDAFTEDMASRAKADADSTLQTASLLRLNAVKTVSTVGGFAGQVGSGVKAGWQGGDSSDLNIAGRGAAGVVAGGVSTGKAAAKVYKNAISKLSRK